MLSIVIVNWNTRDLLRACLESLRRYAQSCPVIVVDNASSDDSADMVHAEFPEVILIKSGKNLGYAAGNNLGFAAASTELILTLNPDTEFFEDTLQTALSFMTTHPDVAVLGARQISTDGSTQRSVRGFPTFTGLFGMWTKLDKVFPKGKLGSYRLPAFNYDKAQPAPQPMGTFNLFRRSTLPNPTAPFDEQFPIFFNEVDLIYRLAKDGRACWYVPQVRIRHHGGESTRQVRKPMIWESHRSLMRFFQKHHPSPMLPFLKLLVYAAALVRAKGVHAEFRP